jgi:hypothetical protein
VVEREVDPRFEPAAVTVASQRESQAPLVGRNVRGSPENACRGAAAGTSTATPVPGADAIRLDDYLVR